MSVQDTAAPPAIPSAGGAANYALGFLLVVYTFNFIDRTLVGVLNEPIKEAFNATDFQMGLLGGPAFAILYTFLGLPIGRLAERFNRVLVVGGSLAIWSVMTVLCGAAGLIDPTLHVLLYLVVLAPVAVIFVQQRMWVSVLLVLLAGVLSALIPLLATGIEFAGVKIDPIFGATTSAAFGILLMSRIGVGIGEAGCSPPSHSLISDYFSNERRASALSIYALGIPIGSMLSAVGGGWLAQNVDWRAAFLWLGLPGIILALVFLFTVKEPPRRGAEGEAAPDFSAVLKSIGSKWTFWNVAIGGAITSFVGYGVGQFLNSFLMRTHGLGQFEASLLFGVVLGGAAAIGTFCGGFISDRLAPKHLTAHAWVPGVGLLIATPLYIFGLFSPSLWVLIPVLVPAAILHYFYLGPMFGMTQGLVEPRMRATASALLLFIVNLIGFALGPPLIGALSDFLAGSFYAPGGYKQACADLRNLSAECAVASADGLKITMIIGVCGYAWGGLHFLLAGRTLKKDIVS